MEIEGKQVHNKLVERELGVLKQKYLLTHSPYFAGTDEHGSLKFGEVEGKENLHANTSLDLPNVFADTTKFEDLGKKVSVAYSDKDSTDMPALKKNGSRERAIADGGDDSAAPKRPSKTKGAMEKYARKVQESNKLVFGQIQPEDKTGSGVPSGDMNQLHAREGSDAGPPQFWRGSRGYSTSALASFDGELKRKKVKSNE